MNTPTQSRLARARWKKAIRLSLMTVRVAAAFKEPFRRKSLRRRLSKRLFSVRSAITIDDDEENELKDLVSKFNLRDAQEKEGPILAVISEIDQESERAQDACILHHQSSFRTAWDYFMFALISYLMVSIPYEVAFVEPSDEVTFWSTLGIMIDVLFWVDIALTFNTSYKDGQILITDRKKIAIWYLKLWFWIDLCAALPLDVIIASMIVGKQDMTAKGLKMVKSVRLLRQLRMLKLLRLMRIARLLRSKTKISYAVSRWTSIVKMMRLVLVVLLLAHLMACIWFSLSDTSTPHGGFLAQEYFSDPDTIYLRALYHTIAMLISDQGGVEPLTRADFIFCSICMMSGAVAISIVFGQMALIISNMNSQKSVFQKKMETLHTTMKYLNLPESLKQRVFKYYRTLWDKHRSIDGNLGWFISELSENLQTEVTLCLRKNVLDNCKAFQHCSSDELLSIIMMMKRLFFLKDDYIIKPNAPKRGLFVIHSGSVRCGEKTYNSGDVFDTGPVIASSDCELLWLPPLQYEKLCIQFPNIQIQLENIRNRITLTKVAPSRIANPFS